MEPAGSSEEGSDRGGTVTGALLHRPRNSRTPSKCRLHDGTFFVFCPVFDFEPMIGTRRANPDMANDLLVSAFSQMSIVLESNIWPESYYPGNCPDVLEAVIPGV